MTIFEANITPIVSDFLNDLLKGISVLEDANQKIFETSGIKCFFSCQSELDFFKEALTSHCVEEPDRGEYGDFQTNADLAQAVVVFLKKQNIDPKVIIEPTCGKGNFILAALETFLNIQYVIGVEIYKPYTWEVKFSILRFYLENPRASKPVIEIIHSNVFDFDFKEVASKFALDEVLIIGNPPWVTNSKLGSLESSNLPPKSNFKKHNGFDAITGKGNFDIGEFITLMMFDAFHQSNGNFAFLVKNAVIKNIVYDQKQRRYNVSNLQKLTIDSKKEFNVSVEAALLFCNLNTQPQFTCAEFVFYQPNIPVNLFGWVDEKFVSNLDFYVNGRDIDGVCPFEWRQGIKHDLSSIMELEKVNGHFINGLQEEIILEEDLVFGLLKSSDLKRPVVDQTRKFTIVTQKKIGEDTGFIQKKYPNTYSYLTKNKPQFDLRKSSIYNNKPDFSIFGVGDYSFLPYKICISGLYKTFTFTLVLPQNTKPIMLDDTCYLLGFQDLEFATYTHILLNSDKSKKLLQAITFSDAKRTFTKDVLMRIDLYKLALQFSHTLIQQSLNSLNEAYGLNVDAGKWEQFLYSMKPKETVKQMLLFE